MHRSQIAGFLSAFGIACFAEVARGENAELLWSDVPSGESAGTGAETWVAPSSFRDVRLDVPKLDALLVGAPREGSSAEAGDAALRIPLPRPDGAIETFEILESPVMEPGLAIWFESVGFPMKTYAGRSVDRPATLVRLDWGGPAGFHAFVTGP